MKKEKETPIIRGDKNYIYVLSPRGYLVDYCHVKDFAGSMFEASLAYIGKDGRFDRLSREIEKSGHRIRR